MHVGCSIDLGCAAGCLDGGCGVGVAFGGEGGGFVFAGVFVVALLPPGGLCSVSLSINGDQLTRDTNHLPINVRLNLTWRASHMAIKRVVFRVSLPHVPRASCNSLLLVLHSAVRELL